MPDDPDTARRSPRHVALIGAMGSGKTTIGVPLAVALGRPFVDNDAQLFDRTGLTAAQLAERDGVQALHDAEAEGLLDALRVASPSVVAAAASTIVDAAVRRALKRDAFVVWLRAASGPLVARLSSSTTRPFSSEEPARLVDQQARERDPLFAELADLAVDSDRSSPDRVIAQILEQLPAP